MKQTSNLFHCGVVEQNSNPYLSSSRKLPLHCSVPSHVIHTEVAVSAIRTFTCTYSAGYEFPWLSSVYEKRNPPVSKRWTSSLDNEPRIKVCQKRHRTIMERPPARTHISGHLRPEPHEYPFSQFKIRFGNVLAVTVMGKLFIHETSVSIKWLHASLLLFCRALTTIWRAFSKV